MLDVGTATSRDKSQKRKHTYLSAKKISHDSVQDSVNQCSENGKPEAAEYGQNPTDKKSLRPRFENGLLGNEVSRNRVGVALVNVGNRGVVPM